VQTRSEGFSDLPLAFSQDLAPSDISFVDARFIRVAAAKIGQNRAEVLHKLIREKRNTHVSEIVNALNG
jgi:hypothetical protein